MLVKLKSAAISGVDGTTVDVEVRLQKGTSEFSIIGLGDNAIREARDRVRSSILTAGFERSEMRVLINLAPAELKKEGSGYDLPMALGVMAAAGMVCQDEFSSSAFHGELALDGRVRPVRGVLPMALVAYESGLSTIFVPYENAAEAAMVSGLTVIPIRSLVEAVSCLNGNCTIEPFSNPHKAPISPFSHRDIADVWGQEEAKRAMLIAAAGGHNLLMIGPPGCGKSMLAECFAGLLPPLTPQEAIEVVKIHSVVGLSVQHYLAGERPYRAPHHVVSDVGLIGGGTVPRPGEISLAHRGVLFLDELPEFRRSSLESLRTPIETGRVSIVRSRAILELPSRFQLIAAMNPCPCGSLGGKKCSCSAVNVANYLRKLSQPILDRIDLHVELQHVPLGVLGKDEGKGRSTERLQKEVIKARTLQLNRQGVLNADIEAKKMLRANPLSPKAEKLIELASKKIGISARGFTRILRVARTIADLSGDPKILESHIAEAIGFRALERLSGYLRAA